MKNLTMLTMLTQLGLSVALPPLGFILLAVWLSNCFRWGSWVVWVGAGLGIYCSVTGFLSTLRTMRQISANDQEEEPPLAFNDHK